MTDNQLVPVELLQGPLTEYDFNKVSATGSYLPRLQLYGGNSDACKEGKIGIGRWGLTIDDSITDLTPEVDVVILSWRPKALQIDGETIITEYDPNSDNFKKIAALSDEKDSGCMFGPEFLVYIPGHNFATLYMSSKTARREAKNVRPLLGKAATLKCRLIKTVKYSWHGPVVVPCSAPLTLPPLSEIQGQITKFQNPPKQEVEIVSDEGTGRAR